MNQVTMLQHCQIYDSKLSVTEARHDIESLPLDLDEAFSGFCFFETSNVETRTEAGYGVTGNSGKPGFPATMENLENEFKVYHSGNLKKVLKIREKSGNFIMFTCPKKKVVVTSVCRFFIAK